MMLSQRNRFLIAACFSTAGLAAGGEPCDHKPLTVREVLKRAKRLDGTFVCVSGLVVPLIIHEDGNSFVLDMASAGGSGKRLGVFDASNSEYVRKEEYRPDTLMMFSDEIEAAGKATPSPAPINVVFFGMVLYKRNVLKELSEKLPDSEFWNPLRRLSYPVEFAINRVVAAKRTK